MTSGSTRFSAEQRACARCKDPTHPLYVVHLERKDKKRPDVSQVMYFCMHCTGMPMPKDAELLASKGILEKKLAR